jgi:Sulfotransferase family
MIEGYVGQVLPEMILGWAFNRARPSDYLVIDIYCGDRHLGSTNANIYRTDLAKSRIGEGDHGFQLRFPDEIEPEKLADIVVYARSESDPTAVRRELPRYVHSVKQAASDVTANTYRDETQFPVFVLGAPRSGTSAVAQALMAVTPYTGYSEGQVLDLVSPLLHTLARFYETKSGFAAADRDTMMIKKFPEAYFENAICTLFADAMRELYPSRHWCDKTPTPDMIWAAPQLLRIWPNAKFIFLKRRALENVSSRIRKFRSTPFEDQCLGWTAAMEAWRAVRGGLGGRAVELDQHFLAHHPNRSAEAIGNLLGLPAKRIDQLARVLARHRPQQTSASVHDITDVSALDWDTARWAIFDRICGAAMNAYGYSRDQSYYVAGSEAHGCIAL